MKKLYGKGTVHPSPATHSDENKFLSLLPMKILSLVTSLSVQDREVLAYLISNEPSRIKKHKEEEYHHSPLFTCNCFSCYTSYWVRWDTSRNRQVIHKIIDAYEDCLEMKKKKSRKKRSGRGSVRVVDNKQSRVSELGSSSSDDPVVVVVEEDKGGSVGKIMSFIGQKVFGVWG